MGRQERIGKKNLFGRVYMAEESSLVTRAEILSAPDVVPLTTAEVAKATGLAIGTLWRWACENRPSALLPYAKRAGRNLYRPSDVRRWLGTEPAEESARAA